MNKLTFIFLFLVIAFPSQAQLKLELKSNISKSSSNAQKQSESSGNSTKETNSSNNTAQEEKDPCKGAVTIKENEFDGIKYLMTPKKYFASQTYTAQLVNKIQKEKSDELYIALEICSIEMIGTQKSDMLDMKTSTLLLLFEDGSKYEFPLHLNSATYYFKGDVKAKKIVENGVTKESKTEQARWYYPEFTLTKEQLNEIQSKTLKKIRLIFNETTYWDDLPYNWPSFDSKKFFIYYAGCLLVNI